ncbi:uncharacterized mitochondrial protein AtMg00810-like [Miscanthus floridulus]|uniref:uncharacterized mitochondrial protein AtMg00810-like n=1 Tax=Miscanthus floridulus TaxID=154761 RepID=UPI003459A772
MVNCKPASTPIDTKGKLSSDGPKVDDAKQYRSLAGALQYLTITRPDLAFGCNRHDPRGPHQAVLKRNLQYIRGTISMGLCLRDSSDLTVPAYSDADWAGSPDSQRSTSGICIFLGDALVSWSSKRQPRSLDRALRLSIAPAPTPLLSAYGCGTYLMSSSAASPRPPSPIATMSPLCICPPIECFTNAPST